MPDIMKIVRDGVTIEVNDAFIASLDAKITKLSTDLATANTTIGTLTADVSTKAGEIAALTAKLKDADLTPAKLDAAVSARAIVIDAAKKILPTLDATGKTDAEIRKLAVDAKLPGHTLDDNGILGAFAALAATADPLASAIRDHKPNPSGEKMVKDAYAEMVAHLTNPDKKAA